MLVPQHARVLQVAALAGVATGLVAWWTAGSFGGGSDAALADARAALRATPKMIERRANQNGIAALVAQPLFPLTAGPGAVTEPRFTLNAVVHSGARHAALIAVDDQPATWVEVGATLGATTVHAIKGSRVTLDTPVRFRSVDLYETEHVRAGQAGASYGATEAKSLAPPSSSKRP